MTVHSVHSVHRQGLRRRQGYGGQVGGPQEIGRKAALRLRVSALREWLLLSERSDQSDRSDRQKGAKKHTGC